MSSRFGSAGLAPYTDDDDATMTCGRVPRRAALQHCERARGVCMVSRDRVLQGPRYRRSRCEVHDRVDSGGRLRELLLVEYGPGHQLDVCDPLEVLAFPARQIVDHDHAPDVVAFAKRLAEIGSYEAGAAGDEDVHCCCPTAPSPPAQSRSTLAPRIRLRVSSTKRACVAIMS